MKKEEKYNSQKGEWKPEIKFFHDELNDEFSTAEIEAKKIDGSYRYERTKGISGLAYFFCYRMVAVPLAFCYLKLKFRHRVEGKEKIKPFRKSGKFFFGNHTQIIGDALIPTFACFPEHAFVIVHANNVSMPFLGRFTPYMGALPLPEGMEATRNFTDIIRKRVENGKNIFIYPEAHIWPYYTKIRPFGDSSFIYPVKHKTPVFCFTNVYKARGRKGSGKAQIVTCIDGPFFPDESLSPREARKKLRNEVYEAMCLRARESNIDIVEYRRAEENTDG